MNHLIALSLPAALIGGLACAQERGPVTLEAGIGTFGVSVEGAVRVSERLASRGIFGQGSYRFEETSSGETYAGNLEALGLGLLADYYPWGGGFRISGGAFLPDYSATLVGRGITIGPATSDIEVSIADRSGIAPALAVGFGTSLTDRIRISGDLGALYLGGFDITARDPGGTFSQAQIDGEISEIRDTLGDVNIVPYASLSIGMSF